MCVTYNLIEFGFPIVALLSSVRTFNQFLHTNLSKHISDISFWANWNIINQTSSMKILELHSYSLWKTSKY